MNLEIHVIKVINPYTIVINYGSEHGINEYQKFLIYSIDPEPLIDPITKENLGTLEIVKGTAKVKHIQEKATTIESNRYTNPTRKVIQRKANMFDPYPSATEEILDDPEQIPFEDVKVGDLVKLI